MSLLGAYANRLNAEPPDSTRLYQLDLVSGKAQLLGMAVEP